MQTAPAPFADQPPVPSDRPSVPHWTHLALRSLLDATLHRLDYGGYLHQLEDAKTADVAEAMRKAHEMFGTGPVPAGWLGTEDFRRIPAGSIMFLLQLCRAIGNEDRLKAMAGPLAISTLQGAEDLDELQWALKALLPLHDVVRSPSRASRKSELQFLVNDVLSTRRPRRFDAVERMAGTAAGLPILLILPAGDAAPRAVASVRVAALQIEPVDGTVVRWFLSALHPEASPDTLAALDLPDDEALEAIDMDDLLTALRNPAPEAAAAGLRALATPVVKEAGPRLADLAGYGAVKAVALQIVSDLAAWQRGELPWGDVTRGLLLSGPPGTGKTELARVMAREAGITFESGSYGQWQKHGNMGDMLREMDRTFARAKAAPPAILFIDEIDGFGSRRTQDQSSNASYEAKVITALLQHLDGVDGREGVVVIGACNHVEMLDPAIRRPGRFDRVLHIGPPCLEDLPIILRQHLGDDLADADLTRIAAMAQGRTGAECAAAVRNARAAARQERRAMAEVDLEAVLIGSFDGTPKDVLYRTAVHEAGHAIVAVALGVATPVILGLTSGGGLATMRERPGLVCATDLHHLRMVDLAGRAAERIVFGHVAIGSGGAADSDLARATRRILEEELSEGIGALGPIWCGPAVRPSAFMDLPQDFRDHVRGWLKIAEDDAVEELKRNESLLVEVGMALLERRVIAGTALAEFMSRVEDSRAGVSRMPG
ncbi:AAA family ATPase [Falsirhodobacter deserti]|uniref:AAA family ATPase n=1 Tax=Falsirhodobacter deserti TaxID=1365611 RepID=UPI000FE33B9F|nr:AAA family ATPase [Falsirhodobacter deserti]